MANDHYSGKRSHHFKDITGQKFGRLTVTGFAYIKNKRTFWHCLCDCGNDGTYCGKDVKRGNTRSCGCIKAELNKQRLLRHGMRRTVEYTTWESMKRRCYNPNQQAFKRYGLRGIAVCDRWLNSFENFYADMGKKPSPQHSIDRIDNDKGYSPENCRWAINSQQARNTSRNKLLEFDGQSKTIIEWSETLGISQYIISTRLRRDTWCIPCALQTPANNIGKNRHTCTHKPSQ